MRVLIVDDSVVFRSQIKAALEGAPGIVVAGVAANGKVAVEKLEQGDYDVVILDLEMPEMNGLETLAEMRRRGLRQRVIVFASPTQAGALQALEALHAGASDFVAKPAGASLQQALEGAQRELVPKILQFSLQPASRESVARPVSVPVPGSPRFPKVAMGSFKPRVVAIGCSTGGPSALEKILLHLKGRRCGVPILIVQHMPPHFTACLARRLEEVTGLPAAEGQDGQEVLSGQIYVAPGDFHMSVQRLADTGKVHIRLDQGPKRHAVRPAVDPLFESVARSYGATAAAFVLTGMGEDGALGAASIKEATGGVMIQDKESSIVWGMPGAVYTAGAYDVVGDLAQCGSVLANLVA